MDTIRTIGRRKTSVARICLASGKGHIKINKKPLEDYFPTETLRTILQQPLYKVGEEKQYDIWINVRGGGLTGQAEATRLAIARALVEKHFFF